MDANNPVKVHQTIQFHQKQLSKNSFIRNQFHPKPFFHVDTFIKNHSKTIFITNQIESWDRTKHDWNGKKQKKRLHFCEDIAGRRLATFSEKLGLCPPFGFHRPPHEGLLKVERRVFRCLVFGLRVEVLGFRFQVFKVYGSG